MIINIIIWLVPLDQLVPSWPNTLAHRKQPSLCRLQHFVGDLEIPGES